MVTVTLPDAWALVAPCGCVDGMRLSVLNGVVITATAEEAWAKFTPHARDRAREAKQGFTCRGAQTTEALSDCQHDPKWGIPVKS